MPFCTDCGKDIKEGFKRCPICSTASDANLDKTAGAVEDNKKDNYKADGYGSSLSVTTSTLPKTVDSSNPDIKNAIKQISSHKDSSNWLLLGFEGSSDQLQVVHVGQDGLEGLKQRLSKSQGGVLFGVLLVIGSSEDGGCVSRHDKLVYFSFLGMSVPEMLRAQANVLKRQVQSVFGSTALTLEIDGASLNLVTPNTVGFKLMNASGSHKSSQFDFGGSDGKVSTKSFTQADDEEESEEDFD